MGEFFKCGRSFVGEGVRVDELDTDLDCVFEEFGYCNFIFFSLSLGVQTILSFIVSQNKKVDSPDIVWE